MVTCIRLLRFFVNDHISLSFFKAMCFAIKLGDAEVQCIVQHEIVQCMALIEFSSHSELEKLSKRAMSSMLVY